MSTLHRKLSQLHRLLGDILAESEHPDLRPCRGCVTVFLRADPRQVFCSRRCQSRFNTAVRRAVARGETGS